MRMACSPVRADPSPRVRPRATRKRALWLQREERSGAPRTASTRQQEGRARKIDRRAGAGETAQGLRHQQRADNRGEAHQAGDAALQLALLSGGTCFDMIAFIDG